VCDGCFRQKLSWWTSEASHPKKVKESEEPTEGEESEENDGNGEVWMRRFSMMKVGPPKGIKPAAHQNNTGEGPKESASPRRPVRTVGEEAKRRLKRYCESTTNLCVFLADVPKYLHTLPTNIQKPKVWLG